jgi:hypothetical protein
MTAWQEFEKLAQTIQGELSPHAAVSWNESLRGKSGVSHQCDIVVRQNVGQYEFTCVLECKDYSEKVGLATVRDFESRLRDLGVSQGVLVAARGFTEDATTYAKACGILTYTLVDAASVKWSEQAMLPVAVVYVTPLDFDIRFFETDSGRPINIEHGYEGDASGDIYLRSVADNGVTTASNLVQLRWDDLAVARVPALEVVEYEHRYELIPTTGGAKPVSIKITHNSEWTYYYNWVPLAKGRGFVDHSAVTLLTASEIESHVDFLEAMRTWPSTKDQASVPLRPLMTFWLVRTLIRRNPNTPRALVFGRTGGP